MKKALLFIVFIASLAISILNVSCKKDVENIELEEEPEVIIDGPGDGVTDINGNYYPTVIINGKEWMAENLRSSQLNDGTPLEEVEFANDYVLYNKQFKWYGGDEGLAMSTKYGAFYNEGTVETDKICPEGWHVPIRSEYEELAEYVGGNSIAGKKLKSSSGWLNGGNGTDDYGFSALPTEGTDVANYCNFVFWDDYKFGLWDLHMNSEVDRVEFDGGFHFSNIRCVKNR